MKNRGSAPGAGRESAPGQRAGVSRLKSGRRRRFHFQKTRLHTTARKRRGGSVTVITAEDQLRLWDKGETIWSIEMGGLGPRYEQALQILAIEIVRDNLGKPLPDPNIPNCEWGNSTVRRIDSPGNHLGFSGAQVSAARFLAYKWLSIGPTALMCEVAYRERHIQVSNIWPQVR